MLQVIAKEISIPLIDCINRSISNGHFPTELKMAHVIPIFFIDILFDKANFRHISLLPSLSKVYEKMFHEQLELIRKALNSTKERVNLDSISISLLEILLALVPLRSIFGLFYLTFSYMICYNLMERLIFGILQMTTPYITVRNLLKK